jgi:hypothetical protein
MPMMGAGFFSGSLAAASLMGHLVYGAVLDNVYGAQGHEAAVAVAPGR